MIRRFVATAGLSFGLVVSCAGPIEYQLDAAFPPTEQAQIHEAARDWNRYLKPTRQIKPGRVWWVLKLEPPLSARDDDADPRTPDYEWNGECNRRLKKIWYHPQSTESPYAVLLHEFGHSVGVGHTKTGIMMEKAVSLEFTPEVIAACRDVGACL